MVLISDLYEGVSPPGVVRGVRDLVEQGSKVLALCALDEEVNPAFDRTWRQRSRTPGAFVGAMTPGRLAEFVAEAVGR